MEETRESYETRREAEALKKPTRLEEFIPQLEAQYPDLTERVVNFLKTNKIDYPRYWAREKINDRTAPVILAGFGRMLEDMGRAGFFLEKEEFYRSFLLGIFHTVVPDKIQNKIVEIEGRLISVVELFPDAKEEILNVFEDYGALAKDELKEGKSPKQIIWDTLHIDPRFHTIVIGSPQPQRPQSKILKTIFG